MIHIAQIIVPNLDPLDYLVPAQMDISIGDLVVVPVRSKKILGLVWKTHHNSEFSYEKLKIIEQKLDIKITEIDRKFLQWISEYYLFNLGSTFRMLIPSYVSSWILQNKLHLESISCKTPIYTKPEFNPEQIEAVSKITQLISPPSSNKSEGEVDSDNRSNNIIIEGVTGSGKTEVYLAAANEVLQQDQTAQILILLPEISLTNQITDRILKRFSISPVIWHSNITNKQKRDNFTYIMNGDARIIIGARSALFLPYKNLKMIIVDEEHDHSYKQEDGVTYQARDMAIMRAKLGNFPIILASASPSLETIHNIALGKLNLITLSGRYNDNAMPKIHIVDMKKASRKNYFISPILVEALKNNLAKKQQSLLFLNRKGYAPAIICADCGFRVCCKACSTGMVYHKSQKKLKCHQCGYVASLPKICPSCSKDESFIPCGPGVERLSEELKEIIPEAKVITITQDSFSKLKEAETIINSIINNEYDIIIGTQIIAKGHHFPALTLVGVIDADLWGGGGDLRSAEKTYQLLQQVGGRAGREISESQIFIQTYNPEHPLILALASYNRIQFIEEEMRSRKEMYMPPFGRLASIIISSKQEQKLINFASELIKASPNSNQFTLLGPAPALLYKLRGKFRYRILIKTARNINIQKFLQTWINNLKIPSHIYMKIDIDPYYFL